MPIAAIRYNNPFNISLPRSGYFGGQVVGLPGQTGYAAFPDLGTGYAAGSQRLNDYITGNTSYGTLDTLNKLGPIYATDPNWKFGVSAASGIGLNETLDPNNATQIAQLQNGILQQELGPDLGSQLAGQYSGGAGGSILQSGDLLSGDGSNLSGGFYGGSNLSGDLSGGTLGNSVTGADTGSTFASRFDAINAPPSDAVPVQTQSFAPIDVASGPDIGTTGAGAGSDVTASTPATPPGSDVSQTGSGATSGGNLPSGAAMINPVAVGFQQSLVSDVGGWVANVEKAFGSGLAAALKAGETAVANYFGGVANWFVRAGLIFLGIVLISIGILVLMWDHGGEQVATKAMKAVAA